MIGDPFPLERETKLEPNLEPSIGLVPDISWSLAIYMDPEIDKSHSHSMYFPSKIPGSGQEGAARGSGSKLANRLAQRIVTMQPDS